MSVFLTYSYVGDAVLLAVASNVFENLEAFAVGYLVEANDSECPADDRHRLDVGFAALNPHRGVFLLVELLHLDRD